MDFYIRPCWFRGPIVTPVRMLDYTMKNPQIIYEMKKKNLNRVWDHKHIREMFTDAMNKVRNGIILDFHKRDFVLQPLQSPPAGHWNKECMYKALLQRFLFSHPKDVFTFLYSLSPAWFLNRVYVQTKRIEAQWKGSLKEKMSGRTWEHVS